MKLAQMNEYQRFDESVFIRNHHSLLIMSGVRVPKNEILNSRSTKTSNFAELHRIKMKIQQTLSVLIVGILFFATSGLTSHAEDEGIVIGKKISAFNAVNQEGDLWRSSDYIGKKILIVYFYPAAMTGGCTKQACAYRDDAEQLEKLDAVVVGVSGDVPSGLKVFQESHGLNFNLLADYDGKIANIFGVPTRDGGAIQRNFNGKEVTLQRGITASRWTFVVDRSGKVVYKNRKVNAAQDSENIIAFLKSEK